MRRAQALTSRVFVGCALLLGVGGSVLLAASPAHADPAALAAGTTSGAPGDDVHIDVGFTSGDTPVASLQFTLVLPAELTFVSAADGPADIDAGKSVLCANGLCLVFGINTNEIHTGTLVTLTLHLSPAAFAAVVPVSLTGLVAATPGAIETPLTSSDGSVSVVTPDFLCYKTRPGRPPLPRFATQRGVVVVDGFSSSAPTDQHELDLVTAASLCNPADRDGSDPAAPAGASHLEGYRAKLTATTPKQPSFVKSNQQVTNGLGTLVLALKSVDSVLVASAKAIGSGGAPPLSGNTLDHFKCYKAAVAKAHAGQPPLPVFTPAHVMLTDEFGGPHAYDVVKPTKLCAPATVAGDDPTAPSHAAYLICYQTKLAKQPVQPKFVATTVSTTNQFGAEVIAAKSISELCVFSTDSPQP